MKLTLNLIRRALGPAVFQRGLAYHTGGKVLEFNPTPNGDSVRLTASTTGSQGEVYQQDIKLVQKADEVDIDGHCTCPVLYNCKHVAAACCAWVASLQPTLRSAATPTAIARWLAQVAVAGTPEPPVEDGDEYVVYLFDTVSHGRGPEARDVLRLEPRAVKRSSKSGRVSRGRAIDLDTVGMGYGTASRVTTPLDREIATLLSGLNVYHSTYALRGHAAYHALQLILDSGRAHWGSPSTPPLTRGESRRLQLRWAPASATLLALEGEVDGGGLAIPSEPPLYLDPQAGCIGELDTGGLNGAQLALLESAPPVATTDAERVATELVSTYRRVPIPPPVAVRIRDNRGHAPHPRLTLRGSRDDDSAHAWLLLDVAYGDDVLPAEPGLTLTTLKTPDGYVTVTRDVAGEIAVHERLRGFGFERAGRSPDPRRPDATAYVAFGDDEADDAMRWAALLRARPVLEADGWSFVIADDFPLAGSDRLPGR